MAQSFVENLSEYQFTDATIRRMYELADKGKTDEKFQRIVYGIANRALHGQWKNYRAELESVFNWFKAKHDYRRDPHNVELVQDVWATMDRRRFDCDDACIWLCAASEILGAPCRFITVSTRPDNEPSHVYLEVFVGGRWEPMDASVQYSAFGWAPASGITNKKIWSRADVGLSGYEERPMVEGLGMHDSLENSMPGGWTDDGYNVGQQRSDWEGGFARDMFRVKPEGIPDDVSNTFAPGMPGSEVETQRTLPSERVNSVADDRKTVRPDDPTRPYPQEYPISSSPSPAQLDYTLPRRDIPMNFDPSVWNGSIPTWGEDPSYMLPIGVRPEAQSMDYTLSGYVSEAAVDELALGGFREDLAKLPPRERHAARVEYMRLLKIERAKRAEAARAAYLQRIKDQEAAAAKLRAEAEAAAAKRRAEAEAGRLAQQARHQLRPHGHARFQGIDGMGGFFDDLVAKAKALFVAGKTATVQSAADIVTQQASAAGMITPATYVPPAQSTGLPSWVIPAVVVAGVAVVGLGMGGGRSRRRR